jgi:spermidine synthase
MKAQVTLPTTGTIYKQQWNGQSIEIRDIGNLRSLYFDSEYLQSRMSFTCIHELVLSYTRFMALGVLLNRSPQKILIIGLGAGSLVRFFHHFFPDCEIDAVDASEHVIRLAEGYFMLPKTDTVRISCEDGFKFLQNAVPESYDFILVDAFDSRGMAPAIYQKLFFDLSSQSLSSAGIASFNLWSSNKKVFGKVKNDLRSSFTETLFLPVPGRGNVVAVAMKTEIPWDSLLKGKKELREFSSTYLINFQEIIKVVKQNNLSISDKIRRFFNP